MRKLNILNQLDNVIRETADNIYDFISDPRAFTRTRKLDPFTMLKVTINMQGNSLDKELYDAFSDSDDKSLVSTSAYVQQKAKLSPACFEHIFHTMNQRQKAQRLFKSQYRLLAIDGSDFNQLWNPESKNIVKFTNQHGCQNYCQ
ncbi:hypothetical protein [Levilactobacillus senmaizukei]|uniref:hypothetical protein n=1 Tax=Levilactobacillus senmaizukei TaxID=431273 RepID=UPI0007834DF7|nr:hypothetical protein [Levilactobacillus senmaizukei]